MPRQARLDAPGTLHHVMIRGIERSPIVCQRDDQRSREEGKEISTGSEMKTSIDNAIKQICCKEVAAEQELRMGVRTRKYSRVRAELSYYLSHEFGVSRAEIARLLGVCTSAIAKAIQNMEGAGNKC